jgi:hypothetical protein
MRVHWDAIWICSFRIINEFRIVHRVYMYKRMTVSIKESLLFYFKHLKTQRHSPKQWSQFLATDPEVRVRFRRYQIFWEVVGLKRGSLSLVSTIEELLGKNSRGSGLENRDYGRSWFTALTTLHSSFSKSWHQLRQQEAFALSVQFARGLRPRFSFPLIYPAHFSEALKK